MNTQVKDKVQRAGLNLWHRHGCRGTLEYATGVGKTKCGVLAAEYVIKHNPTASILILTPTQAIRDNAWKDEFKKWGAKKIYNSNVETACIQTACKYSNEHYDLVIADEIHNYIPLTDEYVYYEFFENNQIDKLLGLSASISEELAMKLNVIAPIVDSININKAVELGLVAPFEILNIPVQLTVKEQNDYNQANAEFVHTFEIFNKDLGFMFKCMKNKPMYHTHLVNRFNMTFASPDEKRALIKQYESYPFKCNKAMRERKTILYNASMKFDIAEKLSSMLLDKKGLIFSESAAFADEMQQKLGDICVAEHSKIKPAKQRKENLRQFQDGRTKVTRISAVRSLNEGVNLNKVQFIIIASGTSKLKDFIQRAGRSIRWEDGKTAIIIRLYVKGSQEEKWVASSQEGYKVIELLTYKEVEAYV